jgi:hypothetical protein
MSTRNSVELAKVYYVGVSAGLAVGNSSSPEVQLHNLFQLGSLVGERSLIYNNSNRDVCMCLAEVYQTHILNRILGVEE